MYQPIFKTVLVIILISSSLSTSAKSWRGLEVVAENRCSPYNKSEQYRYPQSIENAIVKQMGGRIYGPYSGRYFESDTYTDIEHIVATTEGHDSGLCSAPAEVKLQFATDLLNLTLAAPEVNRCGARGKCGKDAAEWMPEKNRCWFASRVVAIKNKYQLTVDQAEVDALEAVLSHCQSNELVFFPAESTSASDRVTIDALDLYDDNNNGKITCKEARKHGIAPVSKDHVAYAFMNDRDQDGVVCE
ncbi:hypothetical protein PRUB_a1523 [Pseudoalteromonas rubra]|uniref:Excalibur calcium-binding domain-containing protein n=1 Tax=Pseudoalteromonas rubra TaxID=43658 RepID=A0A8T0CFA3_9GAMM|nr:excalibur calcium-binding domain-containing protein [Pseudoalteromonas rubra]KAF7788535.1 hypothetical protein PRUB_a1523 [Pseudoalteromonas rubra]